MQYLFRSYLITEDSLVWINNSKVGLFVPECEYNFKEVCLEKFRMLLPLKLMVLTDEIF